MHMTCPSCTQEFSSKQPVSNHYGSSSSVDEQFDTCPICGATVGSGRLANPIEDAGEIETQAFSPDAVDESAERSRDLPKQIGRYQILSCLAQGGFGKVYLALDPDLDRQVALKTPRPDRFSTWNDLTDFLEEARMIAKLRHPGIVTVYDVGRDGLAGCFIAMEFVEGQTLAGLLKTSQPSTETVVALLVQVAEAVHSAHEMGVVHRDLKPANILLGPDDRPRVSDFGLARLSGTRDDAEGQVAGTYPYMSPEQVRGDVQGIDRRTDVWSLGVILYQALTRRLPFKGESSEIIQAILHQEPVVPRHIDATIPVELEAIVLKCLAKSPDDRYPTADDLAIALRSWLAASPTRSPSPIGGQARKFSTATTRWSWAAALLLLLGGLGYLGASRLNGMPQPDLADSAAYGAIDSEKSPRRLRPLVWNDLLQRPPTEICFPHDHPASSWHYDPRKKSLSVTSRANGIFHVGDVTNQRYRLQIRISKNEHSGTGGLMFGYQEIPIEDGHRAATFRLIELNNNPNGRSYLIHSLCLMYVRSSGVCELHRNELASLEMERTGFAESLLWLEIRDGVLRDVHWNGQSAERLLDIDHDVFRACADPRFEDRLNGGVGVRNSFGTTNFSNFQVMPLDLEETL